MAVYLIRAGMTGPVKIGLADDPIGRTRNLQVAHAEVLHLLRVWNGGPLEEKLLHNFFSASHIRGEWFEFSEQMLGDVGLSRMTDTEVRRLAKRIPEEKTIKPLSPEMSWRDFKLAKFEAELDERCKAVVKRIRLQRGLSAKIMRGLGLTSRSAISQWVRVPPERVLEVEKITGIPCHELRPDLYDAPKNGSLQ